MPGLGRLIGVPEYSCAEVEPGLVPALEVFLADMSDGREHFAGICRAVGGLPENDS
ncbi:Uncharacterised protein [Mycobacteroides abscessus subsp. abscessus]|nr:Uncharacterised protein [Mycobacteroides abscessus subsp. abscessus]